MASTPKTYNALAPMTCAHSFVGVTWPLVLSLSILAAAARGDDRVAEVLRHAVVDLVANASTRTSDSHPTCAITRSGNCWLTWQGYLYGQEQIFGCRIGPSSSEPPVVISQSPGVQDHPQVIAEDDENLSVFWATQIDKQWRIVGRQREGDQWTDQQTLSAVQSNALHPVAAELPNGHIVVAWQDHHDGRFRIVIRIFNGSGWNEPRAVSGGDSDAFRPALVVDDKGGMWCFWDTYDAHNYGIVGRPIVSSSGVLSLGNAERITPREQNCLKPVAALNPKHGLCVSWLRLVDIRGGEGAIDQLHTLHMAIRRGESWQTVTTPDGSDVAASLTHGLLARMHPQPGGIHGYTGRRRHPMLLSDGDRMWLLWERKTHHDGLMTPLSTGQLVGRPFDGQHWDEPVILHSGYVDYRLPDPPTVFDGKTFLIASQLPLRQRRIYHRVVLDLNQTAPFHQDQWPGWKPVQLPLADSKVERQTVEVAGKALQVFWGDLHCHSGLTTDAEGEIDELIHYARDRANLDVVVMQENDFLYDCPLTESEYATGVFHSNAYSRPGRFLALPGFEWTPRMPSHDSIVPTEQPPWRRAFPNHRTVIYPPPGGPLIRHSENGNNILKLADAVEQAGGIMHTQHQEFVLSRRKCEVNVEVASGWRTFIFKPEFIHKTLDAGPHLGFVATSDSHRRNPGLGGGLTAICAESLTAKAVIDALRNRRCWATNGSRIFVDARANGQFMGEVVRSGPEIKLSVSVRGTRPLVRVTLVRDGADIKTFEAHDRQDLQAQVVDQLKPGRHWYYWRIEQYGSSPQYPSNVKVAFGNFAWSSPHFVYVE